LEAVNSTATTPSTSTFTITNTVQIVNTAFVWGDQQKNKDKFRKYEGMSLAHVMSMSETEWKQFNISDWNWTLWRYTVGTELEDYRNQFHFTGLIQPVPIATGYIQTTGVSGISVSGGGGGGISCPNTYTVGGGSYSSGSVSASATNMGGLYVGNY